MFIYLKQHTHTHRTQNWILALFYFQEGVYTDTPNPGFVNIQNKNVKCEN